MERGVYFDGWYRGQHCYHPSLPPRRLRMIDELEDMRATVLVWSALGGGSISLPYLEEEAFGEIPERFRMYGYVNDAEFIAECHRRGIEVFGIVFEAQGWEFPAHLTDGGRVGALNELHGAGERRMVGLSEFTRDEGPARWRPFRDYFPGGLVNSAGEPVEDLFEECCCRDLDGEPYRAHWVEAPDREHVARYMDRNNPVWREYLKAVIRLQIDAGSRLDAVLYVTLPVSAPGMAAAAMFAFLQSWHEFLLASVLTVSERSMTAPVALTEFASDADVDWGSTMAASTVMTIPIVIIFMFLQRYFVRGLTSGAVKG